jgi:TRAP-type transport system small permease protein
MMLRMLKTVRTVADAGLAASAAATMAALLYVVVAGVVSRAFGDPVIWSDELARYLMVWLSCLGLMLASRRRSHIRIAVILDRLPRHVARCFEAAIQLAVAGFGLAVAVLAIGLVERNLDIEAISMPIPQAFLYAMLPLAGIAIAVQGLVEAVERIVGRNVEAPGTGAVL